MYLFDLDRCNHQHYPNLCLQTLHTGDNDDVCDDQSDTILLYNLLDEKICNYIIKVAFNLINFVYRIFSKEIKPANRTFKIQGELYTLLDRLGFGTYGSVWTSITRNGEYVAVKVFDFNRSRNVGLNERLYSFVTETKMANRLRNETEHVVLTLKFIDFGMAQDELAEYSGRQMAGGTRPYSAPESECFSGRIPITSKADNWSLGAILYFLTYGKDLYMKIREHHMQNPHRRPDHRRLVQHPLTKMKPCFGFLTGLNSFNLNFLK
ncbi:hypothetical protein I4U23_009968 [Adineta vaga]|nr:hypothetical protein I4U23_009968 [Adineta vaga]